jgi:hypothetical protein
VKGDLILSRKQGIRLGGAALARSRDLGRRLLNSWWLGALRHKARKKVLAARQVLNVLGKSCEICLQLSEACVRSGTVELTFELANPTSGT